MTKNRSWFQLIYIHMFLDYLLFILFHFILKVGWKECHMWIMSATVSSSAYRVAKVYRTFATLRDTGDIQRSPHLHRSDRKCFRRLLAVLEAHRRPWHSFLGAVLFVGRVTISRAVWNDLGIQSFVWMRRTTTSILLVQEQFGTKDTRFFWTI